MNPDTRRLLPVGYGDQSPEDTTRMFDMLMGRGILATPRLDRRRATWRSSTSDDASRARARVRRHGNRPQGR